MAPCSVNRIEPSRPATRGGALAATCGPQNMEGYIARLMLGDLLSQPSFQERLAAFLQIPAGASAIESFSAKLDLSNSRSGHNRTAHAVALTVHTNDAEYRGNFAVKVSTDNSVHVMSLDDCNSEVEISSALRNDPVFRQHCASSLGVIEAELSGERLDTCKQLLGRNGSQLRQNDAPSLKARAQLDSWVEGIPLRDLVRSREPAASERREDAIRKSLLTIVKLWNEVEHGSKGVLFDTDADDILIAADNRALFIDLDGGRKCGGPFELVAALAKFSLDIIKLSADLSQVGPLQQAHVIADALVETLGPKRALEIGELAHKERDKFRAETRLLLLPSLVKQLEESARQQAS